MQVALATSGLNRTARQQGERPAPDEQLTSWPEQSSLRWMGKMKLRRTPGSRRPTPALSVERPLPPACAGWSPPAQPVSCPKRLPSLPSSANRSACPRCNQYRSTDRKPGEGHKPSQTPGSVQASALRPSVALLLRSAPRGCSAACCVLRGSKFAHGARYFSSTLPFSDSPRLFSSESSSMGNGKTIVVFFSTPISVSVCR